MKTEDWYKIWGFMDYKKRRIYYITGQQGLYSKGADMKKRKENGTAKAVSKYKEV